MVFVVMLLTLMLITLLKIKLLWEFLVDISQGMDNPWILLGDFNVVLDSTEKMSDIGSPLIISDEISTMFSVTDLHDHRFIGNKYTWDNGHTWCKLDKDVCNGIWEEKYQYYCGFPFEGHFRSFTCFSASVFLWGFSCHFIQI